MLQYETWKRSHHTTSKTHTTLYGSLVKDGGAESSYKDTCKALASLACHVVHVGAEGKMEATVARLGKIRTATMQESRFVKTQSIMYELDGALLLSASCCSVNAKTCSPHALELSRLISCVQGPSAEWP